MNTEGKEDLVVDEATITDAFTKLGIEKSEASDLGEGKDSEGKEKEKASKDKDDLSKGKASESEKTKEELEADLKKAEDEQLKIKGQLKELNPEDKGDLSSVEELIKAQGVDISEKFQAVGTLIKSFDDSIGEFKEDLDGINERVEELENQPVGSKSFTTSNFIKKAFEEDEETGMKQLSLSQHKKEVLTILDGKAGDISKGEVNEKVSDAIIQLEAHGSLPQEIIDDLAIKDNIKITP